MRWLNFGAAGFYSDSFPVVEEPRLLPGSSERQHTVAMLHACGKTLLKRGVCPATRSLDRCACCQVPSRLLPQADEEVDLSNVCVVCGLAPLCGWCTVKIPYHCCEHARQRCFDNSDADRDHPNAAGRLCLAKAVAAMKAAHRYFHYGWRFAAGGSSLRIAKNPACTQTLCPKLFGAWDLENFLRLGLDSFVTLDKE